MQTSGLGLLAFSLGGAKVMLTPRQARAEAVPYKALSEEDATTLETLGETLLPGATEAGIAHFVDHQLAAPSEDSLLFIRYMDVPPPYTGFYQGGLAAARAAAQSAYGSKLEELTPEQLSTLVGNMMAGSVPDWQGPPAPLLYFVLRNDAVDVVYGTPQGYGRLDFPYHPHLPPPSDW
jgi:hypothetical protein